MKNKTFSLKDVYGIIRDHYMNNFPYEINFQALDAVNEYIRLISDSACIQKDVVNKTLVFLNPNPSMEDIGRRLEDGLSNSSGIMDLLEDVRTLEKWLRDSGFIISGIATEKMVITKSL